MLGVLDPEAPVSPTMRLGYAVVDIEQQPIGTLADRVNRHLQASRISSANPGTE
jgi:hypothetical protein